MAFDGITIANITKELSDCLVGGRIYKIAQPEKDELILTIKKEKEQYRLLISVDASLPLVFLTDENKTSPMVAPNFCMVLRKHLQNAKILSIIQPGLERIIRVEAEHLDELGDLGRKTLIVEIMGKHSNIIFCDEKDTIIDSMKHISGLVSSVREVLPQRQYFIPETTEKRNPLITNQSDFENILKAKAIPVYKGIYLTFTGISPFLAQELCAGAGLDAEKPTQSMSEAETKALWNTFEEMIHQVNNKKFCPHIVCEKGKPIEYCAVATYSYEESQNITYESISKLLSDFYSEKNRSTRIRQRAIDLRKIVQNALERNYKKLELQLKQEKDSADREKYRIYGELLNTYGYNSPEGAKETEVFNYYTNETLRIPLDERISVKENAKKYFERYGKMKRTAEAVTEQISDTREKISFLESVQTFLEIAVSEDDLLQLKEELIANGYMRKHASKKAMKIHSKPFHYQTEDGYDIYVGKNNIQNDELTFKLANGNDFWFHAKGVPGSHVVVKGKNTQGAEEWDLPDRVFEQAARLAAFYSKNRGQDKVEVDYTRRKNVKRPSGQNPGFVIYHTNYSMVIEAEIKQCGLTLIS